jgi:fatty acid synthase subunit alpha, fungi type
MVLPGDELKVNIRHVGMRDGNIVVKVEAINDRCEKVLERSVEVAQSTTACVFAGQGSQEAGMGMDLYNPSPPARAVWDGAMDKDGQVKTLPLFGDINTRTPKYTLGHPTGLLFATQYAQIALVVTEKAAFEDMRYKGFIQNDCAFAGRSLSEYSALASIADVLPVSSLVDVVFY